MDNSKNLPIQIDDLLLKLDENQLRTLNDKVCARLNLVNRAKNTVFMARFNILDRVYFMNNNRKLIGTITRLNQKSVSVDLDDGAQWRVNPRSLTKIIEQ